MKESKMFTSGIVAMSALIGLIGGAILTINTVQANATSTTDTATANSQNTQTLQSNQFGRGGHMGANGFHIGASGVQEVELTGDTAEKVKAAALAAVPGGTIQRVETDADGATYEAHMTKSDGSLVTVLLDKNFKVTGTETGPQGGHGGMKGGHGAMNGQHVGANGATEELLTGNSAEKAKAAALAAVPGGTIQKVETDTEGADYEAHITKSDGSEVTVKMDKNFKVTSTVDGRN